MDNGDKELEIVGETVLNVFKNIGRFLKGAFFGFKELKKKKSRIIVFVVITVLSSGLFFMRKSVWNLIPKTNKFMPIGYMVYLSPVIPIVYLYSVGSERDKKEKSFDEMFDKIGFYGKSKIKKTGTGGNTVEIKDYPRYMGKTTEGDITIYSFYSNINLSDWRNRVGDLENALDCNILKIENAKSTKKVVKIHAVQADKIIPDMIKWNDEFMKEKDFELVIGENMLSQITVNLNSFPHILVAGETGSGKSVILRLILWQSVCKGAKIYMIDFKGGIEFGKRYEKFGEVITERQRALEMLKELTAENKARLDYFREIDVKNLGEYNKIAEKNGLRKLTRIMVFIDEVAEMLDKSGVPKDEKEVIAQIEREMSTLARLSRATGINLVIGVQRPDANILTGQIKNNIPVRISGRFADKPASEIVLGNTRATELPEIKGRFLFKVGADTLEFQAYYFDDGTMMKNVKHEKGGMLTKEEKEENDDIENNDSPEESENKSKNVWGNEDEGEVIDEEGF